MPDISVSHHSWSRLAVRYDQTSQVHIRPSHQFPLFLFFPAPPRDLAAYLEETSKKTKSSQGEKDNIDKWLAPRLSPPPALLPPTVVFLRVISVPFLACSPAHMRHPVALLHLKSRPCTESLAGMLHPYQFLVYQVNFTMSTFITITDLLCR